MNKELNNIFFLKKLSEIKTLDIISAKGTIIGLDVGDKTIGISVSDRRIKIASSVLVIMRKNIDSDCTKLLDCIVQYNPKLIIFGWPLRMNGFPSEQCKKNLKFIECFRKFLYVSKCKEVQNIDFAKWDERFSTKVVNNIMIEADLSRKRRKEAIDKTAAVYILQGAIDFLNRNTRDTI